MTDLLPCPFCGGEAKRIDVPNEDGIENAGASCIECTKCVASTALHFDRKENLVSSWNKRATQKATDPVYRQVERILDEHSAWIARPNRKVTERIALAATIAAMTVLEKAAADDD